MKTGRMYKSSVFATLDGSSTPIDWYWGMFNYRRGDLYSATESFKQAYKANPGRIVVSNNLGACLAMQGKREEAEKYIKETLSVRPDIEAAKINIERLR